MESGAFWLLDVAVYPPPVPTHGGGGFWIEKAKAEKLRKEARLRETGRFDVPPGREVRLAVDGAFDLRLTADAAEDGRLLLSYRLAWSDAEPIGGGAGAARGSVLGFLRAGPGGRHDLLMVAVNELH